MRLYGEHGIVITDKELESDYNSWIRAKQFIIGDEICKGDRRAFSNTRKGLVTGETVKVNEKFQPLVVLPNLANFVFLSNDATPMYLEGDDRRGFVVDVPDARELGFYQRIWDWYESGGKAALLCYLMHNVSCEKFNPKANAPMTEAKMDMIDRGRVASERVLHYMKDDIDMSKPLRTSGEILVHLEEAKAYTNSTAVAKLLANLRAPKRRLVIPNKGRQVYYALTNYKHWKNASDRG
jgi:hypothetical protein